jgi:hypothetical protein
LLDQGASNGMRSEAVNLGEKDHHTLRPPDGDI